MHWFIETVAWDFWTLFFINQWSLWTLDSPPQFLLNLAMISQSCIFAKINSLSGFCNPESVWNMESENLANLPSISRRYLQKLENQKPGKWTLFGPQNTEGDYSLGFITWKVFTFLVVKPGNWSLYEFCNVESDVSYKKLDFFNSYNYKT